MSSLLHPVGPQPPRVYWRRRLAVVVVLLALVAVLAFVVVPKLLGGDEGGTPGTGSTPGAGSTPAPSSSAPSSATTAACTSAQLGVTVTADGKSYAAGTTPVFAVAITNTSTAACTVDAGEAARELLITSGTDRIWSSKDCPAEPASRLLLLSPGAKDDQAITWQRIRSAEGCAKDLPAPRAGTYTAVVSVAGVTSAPAVFQLG